MSGKIKIAILGYGNIGRKHEEMIIQNNDCEIIALIDIKFEHQQIEAQKEIPYFSSLESFLESDLSAEIIAVCTTNGLHFEQAKTIIENGINVIIEKPIALNSKDALDLETLAFQKKSDDFPGDAEPFFTTCSLA